MPLPPQVRIQSDGTPQDTVITLPSGEELPRVRRATIDLDSGDALNMVTLEIWAPTHDVHAVVRDIEFICVCCGKTISHSCQPDTLGGK